MNAHSVLPQGNKNSEKTDTSMCNDREVYLGKGVIIFKVYKLIELLYSHLGSWKISRAAKLKF